MRKLLCTLLLGSVLLSSNSGWATEVGGRLGLGGKATLGSSSLDRVAGLNVIYWLGRLGIDGIFGLSVLAPDGADTAWELRFGGGVVFNLVQADQTNLGLGGRLLLGVGNSGSAYVVGIGESAGDTGATILIETPLRVEHFFSEHFAINAEVGLQFRVKTSQPGKGVSVGTNTGLFGGAGFLFYL